MLTRVALGCALAAVACIVQAQVEGGRVLFAAGEASCISQRGIVRTLARGDAVFEGDTLRTGREAHLQLRMRDDALIALRPQSQLIVKAYGERALFVLLQGALRSITGSISQGNRDHYQLQGHRVVLGVRGTDHEAFAREEGFYDRVNEGGTYLETAKGRADIAPGQTGFAPPDGMPALLARTPEFVLAFLPPAAAHAGPPPREHSPLDLQLPEAARFDRPPLGRPLENPGASVSGTGVGAVPGIVLPDVARPLPPLPARGRR